MKPTRHVALSTALLLTCGVLAAPTESSAAPAPAIATVASAELRAMPTPPAEPQVLTPGPATPAALTADSAVAGEAVAPPPVEAVSDTESGRKGDTTGRDVYEDFRTGLSASHCTDKPSRWKTHFSSAPERLAATNSQVMPVFAHVVEALREARLPTEYALIPFVESEYRPQARSASGPAGLWQFIASTARNFSLTVSKGVDSRMSPVESTRAAVKYLSELHQRFNGNWRLAVMAYNAGENRVASELRRSGRSAADAGPQHLAGLPTTTHNYVEKLHALSCLMNRAGEREEWMRSLDRPVRSIGATATAPKG